MISKCRTSCFSKREVRRSSPSLLLFDKRLIFNLSTQHNKVFSIEQELSDCVSLENGNGSHHVTSLPLLSLLIRMKSVGILYPATEPCHQISPQPAQLAVSCGCEIKVLAAAPRSKKREQGPYRQLRRLISLPRRDCSPQEPVGRKTWNEVGYFQVD